MPRFLDNSVSFRAMNERDLDRVLQIEKNITEIPWTRRNFQDCLNSDYHCRVLCYDSKHIGHSVLSAAVGEAHLLNISIDLEYQGKGLGRLLLQHMMVQAMQHGAKLAFLEVRDSNKVAQSLYLDEGFNEVGRRVGYYPARKGREDAVIMAIEL